jgi:hypothetical protein
MHTPDERAQIMHALEAFIHQRPGLDPRNYISHGMDRDGRAAYRSEVRSITKDLHHARALLSQVRWRDSIDAEALKTALRGSFSGRLSWVPASTWQCQKCSCVSGGAQALATAPDCCGEPMRQNHKLEYTAAPSVLSWQAPCGIISASACRHPTAARTATALNVRPTTA